MIYGKPSASPRVDAVQPESAASTAGFQPGDLVLTINGRPIESFNEMQEIVSTSAGETLAVRGRPRRRAAYAQGHARAQGDQGQLRQCEPPGRPRHHRSMQPNDINFQPVGPLTAVVLGVQRTWFVIERTLSYIGRIVLGPGSCGSARWSDSDRSSIGASGDRGDAALLQPHGDAVGFDRLAQPISGAAARWRSPSVLCDRGGAGKAAVGTRAGGGVSDRVRISCNADDLCNLQ